MNLSGYFQSTATAGARGRGLSSYTDIALVAGIVAIVALMIVPLPLWLIDLLVAINITGGVLLLLIAIYVAKPLEFSVFPSVLLISTLFRLSLSIATTRMILLHGEAGHIIQTFGHMVAGGNLIVGLVVFLIITVVQFIVIAKGSERVAEVAARFSLDAMPGKQMSIDSDLRSGLIDKDEALQRRHVLENESKLNGALDGAMKFIKGDAIAGIIIIIINLLGGLAIGVMQLDMSMSAAAVKYSILTIGDGMVTQIPALLGAMSAGLLVTRTTDDAHDKHLGDAIGRQLLAKPRVLLVAGGLCVLFAMVPGFPVAVFLGLGLGLSVLGFMMKPILRARWERFIQPKVALVRRNTAPAPLVMSADATAPLQPSVPLLLELPAGCFSAQTSRDLRYGLEGVLDHIQLDIGLRLPRLDIHTFPAPQETDQWKWRLLVYEAPIASGSLSPDTMVVPLSEAIHRALRRYLGLFMGTQEASQLYQRASVELPDVARTVQQSFPAPLLAKILRHLLAENVPVRNLRDIMEALLNLEQFRNASVLELAESVRCALQRQLNYRYAPQGVLRALTLAPDFEELVRSSIQHTDQGLQLALEPTMREQLQQRLKDTVEKWRPQAILTNRDIRYFVRSLTEQDCFDIPIIGINEILPTTTVEPLDCITLVDTPLLETPVAINGMTTTPYQTESKFS